MKNPVDKHAEKCRQSSAGQQISTDSPGTILQDFQTLIDFIGSAGIRTGSHQGNLPAAVLPELNARLHHPLELHLQRPLLRDYPHIAGLYILLRVMDLAHAEDGRVRVNESGLAYWSGLNSVEQYFALLES